MINATVHTLLLFLAAIAGLVVGGAILADPVAFHASAGIEVANEPALLNEMRASGGAIAALGVLVLLGAVVRRLRFAATVAAAFVFLGYGLSRLAGFALDGVPNTALIWIAAVELIIGLACAFALTREFEVGVTAVPPADRRVGSKR